MCVLSHLLGDDLVRVAVTHIKDVSANEVFSFYGELFTARFWRLEGGGQRWKNVLLLRYGAASIYDLATHYV